MGYEVLVSDIVTPGMHGHDLARLIRETRPGIGIELMGGYTGHVLGGGAGLGQGPPNGTSAYLEVRKEPVTA